MPKVGQVSSGDISIGNRFLRDSPHAQLLLNSAVAELSYLPLLCADNLEEKKKIDAQIGRYLGLETAISEGLITSYSVKWDSKTFPSHPLSIRLLPPLQDNENSGDGWRRFVSKTFLKELRTYFSNFANPDWRGS